MLPALFALSNSLAASVLVKATIALVFALIAAGLARTNRASVRHSILTAAFGVVLILPFAAILAPPLRIALHTEQASPTPVIAQTIAIPLTAQVFNDTTPVRPSRPRLSLSTLLLTAWLTGVAMFLLPVVTGLWQVRSFRRTALPWAHGQSLADSLSAENIAHNPKRVNSAGRDWFQHLASAPRAVRSTNRRVEVLLHERVPGPMTSGIVYPAIVLPASAEAWQSDDLQRAIVHELEHVLRADWVTRCLARITCALYWFHPLVWIAWRQLTLEAERACDDAVLERSDAGAYAYQLVSLAKRISTAHRSTLLAMANRADLSMRVNSLLDGNRKRGRAGKFPVALASVVAAAVIAALSPLSIVAAPQTAIPIAQAAPPAAQAPIPAISVPAVPIAQAPSSKDVQAAPPAAAIPHYTSVTQLVIVNVTVSEQNGNAVAGLHREDFRVFEDGQNQAIALFEPQSVGADQAISPYYVLGYYAKNPRSDGAFRSTRVEVDVPNLKVQTKTGYYPPTNLAEQSIGNDANSPIPLFRPEPQYSEQARKAKWQGAVTLNVLIDASGHVAEATVVRPLGLGLDEKAVEAVKQWTFVPGTKNGQPAAVQAQVAVIFRLL